MPQNSLDINTDPSERNLDTVQQKLNKILSTIQQINAAMGGIPSQFSGMSGGGGAGAIQGSAQQAPTAPMASMGGAAVAGYSSGSSFGLNPSIMGSLMLSTAMQSGMMSGGQSSGNNTPWTPIGSLMGYNPDSVMASMTRQRPNMGYANPLDEQMGRLDFLQSQMSMVQGYQGNLNLAESITNSNLAVGMSPGMHDHLGTLAAQGVATRAGIISSVRLAAGGAAISGFAAVGNAYTRATIEGTQNPESFGQAYGGLIGGVAGAVIGGSFAASAAAGAAAGSVVPGAGTLIGAGVGAVIGATSVALAQSPYIARNKTEGALAGYALSSGGSTGALADSASRIANDYDSTNASNAQGIFSGYVGRALHLYTGTDQASQQQVGGIMGILGDAYLNAGANAGGGNIQRLTRRILDRTANVDEAQNVAKSYARAAGNINNAGGNITDLYAIAGADSTETMLRIAGRVREADQLAGSIAGMQRSAYGSTGAASIAQGLSADYDATGYSGASTLARTGSFRSMMSGLQGQVSAVDAELGAISAAPGGQNSNEYKAKTALKSELLKQIAAESSQRAQGISTDIQGTSGVNLTNLAVGTTTASLYGSAGDIRSAATATMGQLSSEASQLRGVTGLSFQDQIARDRRLADISLQQAALPAQAAGAAMRRSLLPLDVAVGQNSVAYQGASLYGDDRTLGAAASGSMSGQQAVIDQARRTLNDPALSQEDRAAATGRISQAQAAMLQIRAGSRDSLLNRIEGRAGVANSDAANALNLQLSVGSGGMVRGAGMALIGSLDQESASLASQLAAGGLTQEQEIRLRGRQSSLTGQRQSVFQSIIDQGIARDDMSDYLTPHMRTQGAQERLQYLPFSASNPMRLSIQSLNENRAQLGVLSHRESDLRAAGQLSPERQYEIERQRQGLLTENAQSVGQLSEGMENRLPALSAGAPSFFGRFNSYQLAAANLQMAGSPIRAFGAVNGAHAASQDAYLRAAGGDMHDITPHSRTSSLNTSGGSMDRLASVLERLAGVLDKQTAGQGDGMRPGERASMMSGSQNRSSTNTQGLYGTRN